MTQVDSPVQCPLCGHEPGRLEACSFCGVPQPAPAHDAPSAPPPGPPPPGAADVLPVGTPLERGLYHVGRVLGRGGFGITYAGSDTRLHRVVAIKEMFPVGCARVGLDVHSTPDFPEALYQAIKLRFVEEARVLARFQHPGIVRVHGFFEENATAYMVMEMLRGETLQDRLERAGALPEAEVRAVAHEVGDALEAVHAAGYLHRDLKPENLIRSPQGRVVLLDFGTARRYAQAARMTAMVTPGYAPPEQYTGQEPANPASDVYALAATLYHLLTGRVPAEAVDRACGRAPLVPLEDAAPGVSEGACRAITRALSLDAAARPRDVRSFLHELEGPPSGSTGIAPGVAPASPTAAPPATPTASPAATPTASPAAAPTAALPASPTAAPPASPTAAPPASPTAAPPASPTAAPPASPTAPRALEDLAPSIVARLEGHRGWIRSLAFTPCGRFLASGSEDRTVRVWTLDGREAMCLQGHDAWVSAIACAPDGPRLASGSHDRTVRIWDLATGACARMLKARDRICALAYAPDGTLLAAGLAGGHVQGFRPGVPEPEALFRRGDASITSLAFSPDGRALFLAAGVDAGISIIDPATATLLGRLEGHRGTVRVVAMHPGGQHLLSGSSDATVRLWNLATRRQEASLAGHRGAVLAVAFSPAQDLAASASQDHTIRLWQPGQGQALRTLEGHRGEVSCVASSPDGRLLATASQDQVILLWSLWP